MKLEKSQKPIIAVFGTSKADESDAAFCIGVQLGKMLADAGFNIANGGYGGTMRAVAKGAAGTGAKIFGVTCTAFKRGRANEFVTDEISSDSLDQRLKKLIELGDGYIILPGGTGTLQELACVWEHKNKGFETSAKPVILLGAFWKPLVEMMTQADAGCGKCIQLAETPELAVKNLKQWFIAAEKK
jgi:uncharacterized protein (TIGR00730 family)